MKTEITGNEQHLIDQEYAPGKKSFEFLTNQINESFNWAMVYKAMKAVDWTWSFGEEDHGIPNLDTIKNHAFKLLQKAYDEEKQISTGGFSAGWDSGELFLVFTLEETSATGKIEI